MVVVRLTIIDDEIVCTVWSRCQLAMRGLVMMVIVFEDIATMIVVDFVRLGLVLYLFREKILLTRPDLGVLSLPGDFGRSPTTHVMCFLLVNFGLQ